MMKPPHLFFWKLFISHPLICLKGIFSPKYQQATQVISELDHERKILRLIGNVKLDFNVKPIEKNWVCFERDNDLYIIYSFNPYRVMKLENWQNLSFVTVINQAMTDVRIKQLGGFDGNISLSTSPVVYDEKHLLMLVHKFQFFMAERLYYHWGVLLDRQTLLPQKISLRPFFSGGDARGLLPGVVYAMSVMREGEDFYFTVGEGDCYASWAKLSKEALKDAWADLNS